MADGEKPTSIWKKELSFRRKPEDEAVEAPSRVRLELDVEEGDFAPQEGG